MPEYHERNSRRSNSGRGEGPIASYERKHFGSVNDPLEEKTLIY